MSAGSRLTYIKWTDTQSFMNKQNINFILIGLVGFALIITGCVNNSTEPVATPTPEIVYVYVTVTPTIAPTNIPSIQPQVPGYQPLYTVGDIAVNTEVQNGHRSGYIILMLILTMVIQFRGLLKLVVVVGNMSDYIRNKQMSGHLNLTILFPIWQKM